MKEHLQTIVWVIGSVTLVVSMGIAWFVWRISKRDSNNKKSGKKNS
jgi:heme/copper-type cytochrome/quinol oxidase subunit 2